MIDMAINKYGDKCHYGIYGKYHNENGPAFIGQNGTQEWWINGKRHRTDGPAYINPDGYQAWFINDKRKTKNKSYQEATNLSDEDMSVMILKYGNVE
jgi:hypothetical protein